MEARFEELVLHEIIGVLASMVDYHRAKALVGLECGFVNAWDDFEERLGIPVDDACCFELGSCKGAEGGDVVLV